MKSKYEEKEDGSGICPFCEKPLVSDKAYEEYEKRLSIAFDNENDPDLCKWADQFCWFGWNQLGECRGSMLIEDRLIEVLEQRDSLRVLLENTNEKVQN